MNPAEVVSSPFNVENDDRVRLTSEVHRGREILDLYRLNN